MPRPASHRASRNREITIDRGESFHAADVERISFRKLDFLRASDFKSFLEVVALHAIERIIPMFITQNP